MRFFASEADAAKIVTRSITAAILLLVLVFVFVQGGLWLYGTGIVLSLLAAFEWDTMTNTKESQYSWWQMGIFLWPLSCVAFICLYEVSMRSAAYVFLVVAAMDVGAYFSGKSFGGPRLAPKLSPKKTWSGFIGGVCASLLVALLLLWYHESVKMHWLLLLVLTITLAAVAQLIGDIGTSAIKRHFGAKDWGSLLPGHGGVLDRFDGHFAAWLMMGLWLLLGLPVPF